MLAAVVSVIALVVVVSVMLHVMSPEVEGAGRGIFGRVLRHVPLQPVKIVIVAWQIITQVSRLHTHLSTTGSLMYFRAIIRDAFVCAVYCL